MGSIGHTVLFFVSLGIFIGSFFHAGGNLDWFHWLLVAFSILGTGKSVSFFIPSEKEKIVK